MALVAGNVAVGLATLSLYARTARRRPRAPTTADVVTRPPEDLS